MTFLLGGVFDVLEVVRQKGDADLVLSSTNACMQVSTVRTKSDLYVGKRLVSYPGCHDACCGWKDTNRPGPFPGAFVSKYIVAIHGAEAHTCGCCCFFMVKWSRNAPPQLAAFNVGQHYLATSAKARPRRRTCRQDQARARLPVRLLTFASSSSHSCPHHQLFTFRHHHITGGISFYCLLRCIHNGKALGQSEHARLPLLHADAKETLVYHHPRLTQQHRNGRRKLRGGYLR